MTALATALRAARPVAVPGALLVVAVAVSIWAASVYVTLSPDARYSLAWGAELARGGTPELAAPRVPTGHPLPVAIGALLAPLGTEAAADGYSALAALSFGLLLYAAFRFARALAGGASGAGRSGGERGPGWPLGGAHGALVGTAAGVLAAVIVGTRPRIDFFAAHAFIDVPFAALVLLAAAFVAESPRANAARALALLAAAGLLRPEAWLLSLAYAAWLAWSGRRRVAPDGGRPGSAASGGPAMIGRRRAAAFAVALGAPAVWAVFDLAFAGDPLHSLTRTQDQAIVLGRVTGLDDLIPSLRSATDDLIGWPLVAAGALVAVWAAGRPLRGLTRPPAGAGAPFAVAVLLSLGGVAAFTVLAVADLPLNDRYLLVPALAVVGLAAAALRRAALRSPLLVAALALTLAGAIATAADDRRQTEEMLDLAREKRAADEDLEQLLARPSVRREIGRCPLVHVSGSGRAAAAALLDRDPSEVPIARSPVPPSGGAAISASRSVPSGTARAIREGAWAFVSRCG
jgi:hypothetical protein